MIKYKYIKHIWLVLLLLTPLHSLGADNKQGSSAKGVTEWVNNCSRCHHMRNPQDNTDDHWEAIMTHMRIRAGLTGQQSRDILAYLQSSNYIAGAVPSTGIAAGSGSPGLSGEQVYSGTCIACHGADGNGAIPGVPVLFERLVKTDETLFKNIKVGFQSPGSTLAMPALGGNPDLADKDIENVVGYLRQKFGK